MTSGYEQRFAEAANTAAAAARKRAAAMVDAAPRCRVCGRAMLLGQAGAHYVCDPGRS